MSHYINGLWKWDKKNIQAVAYNGARTTLLTPGQRDVWKKLKLPNVKQIEMELARTLKKY